MGAGLSDAKGRTGERSKAGRGENRKIWRKRELREKKWGGTEESEAKRGKKRKIWRKGELLEEIIGRNKGRDG